MMWAASGWYGSAMRRKHGLKGKISTAENNTDMGTNRPCMSRKKRVKYGKGEPKERPSESGFRRPLVFLGSGQCQQFGSMTTGRVGNDFTTEHTGNFFNTLMGIQYRDFTDRLFAFMMFANLPVVFATGSHLR